jgi:hypothetical protein
VRINQLAATSWSSGAREAHATQAMPSDDTIAEFCRALKACAAGHNERFRKTDGDYAEFVYHEIMPKFAMVFAVWQDPNAPEGLGVLLVKDTTNARYPGEAQGATAFGVAGRSDAQELIADLTTFVAIDNALIGARMH